MESHAARGGAVRPGISSGTPEPEQPSTVYMDHRQPGLFRLRVDGLQDSAEGGIVVVDKVCLHLVMVFLVMHVRKLL